MPPFFLRVYTHMRLHPRNAATSATVSKSLGRQGGASGANPSRLTRPLSMSSCVMGKSCSRNSPIWAPSDRTGHSSASS